MRRFVLDRIVDHTGISGTGVVVEGVQFTDGRVVMAWIPPNPGSLVIWDDIENVLKIHGHNGSTQLRWIDEEPQ